MSFSFFVFFYFNVTGALHTTAVLFWLKLKMMAVDPKCLYETKSWDPPEVNSVVFYTKGVYVFLIPNMTVAAKS